jgi:hypothetical protein
MAEPEDEAAADTVPFARPRKLGKSARARSTSWPLALVLVWLALAIADIVIVAPFSAASRHPAAKDASNSGGSHRNSAPDESSHSRITTASPSASPSASPRILVPVSASAFGPSGYGSGDNPRGAALAIDGSAVTGWRTSWYRSAAFGNLKAGTGLLIDMGHPVRITRVRIVLDTARGANLELLTGKDPEVLTARLPGLPKGPVQARVIDAGGTLERRLARPRRARYLLIWFTLLPPDAAGTFQEAVYSVWVEGTPFPPAGHRHR